MNKMVFFVLVLILVMGCEKVPSETKDVKEPEGEECTTDNDCVKGGCSGTICQSRDAGRIITTCVYLPEYECYRLIDCGCINGLCQWKETSEFNSCIEGKRELP